MPSGGKRPRSGRKKGDTKAVLAARAQSKLEHLTPAQREATRILKKANADEKWAALLDSDDESIKLKALMYLEDRKAGKAFVSQNPATKPVNRENEAELTKLVADVFGKPGQQPPDAAMGVGETVRTILRRTPVKPAQDAKEEFPDPDERIM